MNEADEVYLEKVNDYIDRIILNKTLGPEKELTPGRSPGSVKTQSVQENAKESQGKLKNVIEEAYSTASFTESSRVSISQRNDETCNVSASTEEDHCNSNYIIPFRRKRMDLAQQEDRRREQPQSDTSSANLTAPIDVQRAPRSHVILPPISRRSFNISLPPPPPAEFSENSIDQSTSIEEPRNAASMVVNLKNPTRYLPAQRPLNRNLAPERQKPMSPTRPSSNLAIPEVSPIPVRTRTVPGVREPKSIHPSSQRTLTSAVRPMPLPREDATHHRPRVFAMLQDLPDISIAGNGSFVIPAETRTTRSGCSQSPPPIVRQPWDNLIISKREEQQRNSQINFDELTSDNIRAMNAKDKQEVLDAMWEGIPSVKYKENFPFYAEGMVSKDNDFPNQLRVYSSRLGKVYVPDSHDRENNDYVYFLVLSEQEYTAYHYSVHPRALISAKFPDADKIVIRGYALLAHPRGAGKLEHQWVCWNDQLGMMKVLSGAARISLKKMPNWQKQLDIVSIHAIFENKKYTVTVLCALTNIVEKRNHLPDEAFLVQDAVLVEEANEDFVFYSRKLNLKIYLKATLTDGVSVTYDGKYQIVSAPTFPISQKCVYRGMFITNDQFFWTKENEYVRERLAENAKAYEEDTKSRSTSFH